MFGSEPQTSRIMVDSLATEDMPTCDGVWNPLSVVRLVANIATRIRVYYEHFSARIEDPYTGGGECVS